MTKIVVTLWKVAKSEPIRSYYTETFILYYIVDMCVFVILTTWNNSFINFFLFVHFPIYLFVCLSFIMYFCYLFSIPIYSFLCILFIYSSFFHFTPFNLFSFIYLFVLSFIFINSLFFFIYLFFFWLPLMYFLPFIYLIVCLCIYFPIHFFSSL